MIALASVAAVVVVISVALREARHHDQAGIVGLSSPLPESEMKILEAAAEAGNPEAQSQLAHEISRYQGYGIRAFRLIRRAAEQGHPFSEYEMGAMLAGVSPVWERSQPTTRRPGTPTTDDATWIEEPGGQGVRLAIDHARAIAWFEKAAEHGVHLAWSELATIYKEGRGVNPDPIQSAKWVRKLANSGDPGYMLDYARRLDNGEGVEPNSVEAFAWTLLVIDSPYPPESAIGSQARTIGRHLESKLSTAETLAGRLRAKDIAKHTSICVGGLQNCR